MKNPKSGYYHAPNSTIYMKADIKYTSETYVKAKISIFYKNTHQLVEVKNYKIPIELTDLWVPFTPFTTNKKDDTL